MNKVKLLYIGGVPNNNLTNVVRWTPTGFDLFFAGNSLLPPLFTDERISAVKVYLGGTSPNNQVKLPGRPDVIFNGICNQESCSRAIEFATHFCAQAEENGVRVINHPGLVKNTTRLKSAEDFQGLDRILVPEIRHLAAPGFRAVRDMLEQEKTRFPFILRTTENHNGANMVLFTGPESVGDSGPLPFDGRDYYAIQHIDYRNPAGVYRKFRLVKIGDRVVPRHMISSSHWKIHVGERKDSENDSIKAKTDEIEFLTDPESFLGSDLYHQLVVGLNKSGLDYAAVDFSILADGRAVFFECNACFNAFSNRKPRTPELGNAEAQITQALIDLVVHSPD